ncbi:hypothetical protein ES703_60631 [subsurface metagenome]
MTDKQILGFLQDIRKHNDKIGKELARLLKPIAEIRQASVYINEILNTVICKTEKK